MSGGRVLAMVAATLIAAIAAARCLVTLLPEIWFDVDPVLNSTRVPGVSPGWLMVLDVVLLAAAAAGLCGEAMRRRGGSATLLVLWVIPIGAAVVWAGVGLDQVRVLLPWVAGITAAVALAHVCRDAAVRRATLAVLLAVAGALVLQGLVQWGWVLPETATWFTANSEVVLTSMGMELGSAEALVYERRVLTGGPSGWFTSANLLATVLAACTIAWFGMVVAAKVRGRSLVIGGIAVVVVVFAAVVTAMTGSLGGVLVLVVGLALVVGGLISERVCARGGWIALGLIVLAAVAPLLVAGASWFSGGLSGGIPGGLPGGRSMLIRWQYDAGAAGVLSSHPMLGAGPAGFQDAYAAERLPGAPEEVISPHAMLWEWTSTLGVLGFAWVGLVMVLVWSAGRRGWRLDSSDAGRWWWPTAAACAALIPAVLVSSGEWGDLDDAGRVVRIVGWMSLPILAWVGWNCLVGPIAGWAVVSAVVLLIVHGQVEMSVHNAASSVWILALLGAAAPTSANGGRGLPVLGAVVGALLCVGAVVWGACPQLRQDHLVDQAASMLIAAPGEPAGADAGARHRAAERLLAAWEVGHDPLMLVHAAEQHLAAAHGVLPDEVASQRWLAAAADEAGRAHALGRLAGGRLALEAVSMIAMLGGSDATQQEAIALAARLCREDPTAAMAWINLGVLLERAGDRDGRAAAWQAAIDMDDANSVDPLQRLPADVRAMAERGLSSGFAPQ